MTTPPIPSSTALSAPTTPQTPVDGAVSSETQPTKGVSATPSHATGIGRQATPQTVSLAEHSAKKHKVTPLQKQLVETYYFNETDARNIAAFAKAFGQGLEKIELAPTVRTKIKSLIAKILKFFGNETKALQLQQEGSRLLAAFRQEIAKYPTATRQLIGDFKNPNRDTIVNGLYWMLSPELMRLAKGDKGNFPQLLLGNETAKNLFVKDILSVTKDQFQVMLAENLGKPVKLDATKGITDTALMKDINRGASAAFTFEDGTKLAVASYSEGIKAFEESLSKLSQEKRDKIKQFCRTFPSQGIFATLHPYLPGIINASGDHHWGFDVTILGDKASVTISSQGTSDEAVFLNEAFPLTISTTAQCLLSFEWDSSSETGTNFQVKQFTQQFGQIKTPYVS